MYDQRRSKRKGLHEKKSIPLAKKEKWKRGA